MTTRTMFNTAWKRCLLSAVLAVGTVSAWAEETTPTYVASIGEGESITNYTTLAAAITAATGESSPGTTITLLQSVTEDVNIPAEKTITIDLGSYSITGTGTNTETSAITNAGTLTLTGTGSVNKATSATEGTTYYAISNTGTLNVAGGTIGQTTTTGAVNVSGGTVLYLDVTADASIETTGEGKVTNLDIAASNKATITGANYGTITGSGTLALGGSIENTTAITFGGTSDATKFTGTISLGNNTLGNITIANGSSATISGSGTITNATNNGTITLNGGTIATLTAGDGSSISSTGTVSALSIASGATTTISGSGYSAISGAGTVKLGTGIASTLSVTGNTIDLNGKTATAITAAEGASLTVKDSSTGANGKVTTLTANSGSTINYENGAVTTLAIPAAATINVIGATLPNKISGDGAAISTITFKTINNSNLSSAVGLVTKATLELTEAISSNVEIATGKDIVIDLKGQDITGALTNSGTLTIQDAGKGEGETTTYGTITTVSNTGALTVTNCPATISTLTATAGTTNIASGTITAMNVTAPAKAEITNGTITTLTVNKSGDNEADVTVSGGTISNFAGDGTIKFSVSSSEQLTQALKAPKAAITLNNSQALDGNYTIESGNEAKINVNGQTISGSTEHATFTNNGKLTIIGTGAVNAGEGQTAIVNENTGTLTIEGAAVASATLDGIQTVSGGTLTAATLKTGKTLTVTGGTVTALTAETETTITSSNQGKVSSITTSEGLTINISGTGFGELKGTGTYKLTDAVTSDLSIPATANVTLDLNGKTLAQSSGNTITVAENGTLTVIGETDGSTINAAEGKYAIESEGTVTINSGTIASVDGKSGTLTVADGTVTKLAANGATITLNGGSFDKLAGGTAENAGNITVGANLTSNFTVINGANVAINLGAHTLSAATTEGKAMTVENGATLAISGDTNGTIASLSNAGTTTINSGAVTDITSSGTLNIAGGTVTTAAVTGTTNITGGTTTTLTVNGGTTTISNGAAVTTLTANNGSKVVVTKKDSETYGGKVTTLTAKNGSTVTLESGSEVTTLDMETGASVIVKAGAKVNGETASADINFSQINSADALTSALNITKNGTLTLSANIVDATAAFIVPADAVITINLGDRTLSATSGNVIEIKPQGEAPSAAAGKLTLTGGGSVSSQIKNEGTLTVVNVTCSEVTNTGTVNVTNSNGIVTTLNSSAGTINISSGTVAEAGISGGTAEMTGGSVTAMTVSGGSATIKGGTVTTLDATGGEVTVTTEGTTVGKVTTLKAAAGSKVSVEAYAEITTFEISGGTVTVAASANVANYAGAGGENVTLPEYKLTDQGTDKTYPTLFKTPSATYTRWVQQQWGTICLPFSLTKPLTNIALYKISKINGTNLELTDVTITEATADSHIVAGTPLIFHYTTTVSDDAVSLPFESGASGTKSTVNANVTAAENAATESGANLTLKGYLATETINSSSTDPAISKCYYINGDQFHKAVLQLTVPAYRAIIVDTSTGSGAPERPDVLNITTESEETALDILTAADSEILGYWDLKGIRHDEPQHGVNIVKMSNGKSLKLMIK